MNSMELAAARQRLGLTPDELAAELDIPPHAYRACEAGRAQLPRRTARTLAFLVAAEERRAALEASGLPSCEWIAEWDRRSPPDAATPAAMMHHLEEAQTHEAGCAVCQARDRFVRERFPDMPTPPLPGWMRLAAATVDWFDARPAWARPALFGAAALAGMTVVRALFMLPAAGSNPRVLLHALAAIVLAAVAGAIGGLVYAFAGRPLRRIPVVGPYLAGIVAVAGYMGAIVALMSLVSDEAMIGDDPVAMIFALTFTSVLFGCVVGHQWLREPRPAVRRTI